MQRVARAWREFKCVVTCFFVYKNRKQKKEHQLEFPFELHPQISKEDYEEFVKQRMDPKFQEISEKARNSQKQNIYRHHLGRAGYYGKKKQWRNELYEQEILNAPDADPKVIHEIVEKLLKDRCFNWIRAHTSSSGNTPQQTQEVIEKMYHWLEKETNGEYTSTRMMDPFVKATGKREHPGRTRGVGGFVGNQEYWGKPGKAGKGSRGKLHSDEKLNALKEEVKAVVTRENMEYTKAMMLEMAKAMGMELPSDFNFNATIFNNASVHKQDRSSCYSVEPDDPFFELQSTVPCRLAVLDYGNLITVAEGTVWPSKSDTLVHHKPLSSEMAHVSIDYVIESSAPLPIPWPGVTKVGDMQGSFAQWPKKWIFFDKDENMSEHKKKKLKSKDTNESLNKTGRDNTKDSKSAKKVGKAKKKSKTNESTRSNNKSTTQSLKDKDEIIETNNSNREITTQTKKDQEDNGPLSEQELGCLTQHSRDLENLLCALSSQSVSVVKIEIDKSVYNYMNGGSKPINMHLIFGDIRQMFKYKWLNITILQIWGRFLHDQEKLLGDKSKIGYMCPQILSSYAMRRYVTHVLKIHQGKKYVMGAFFQESWRVFTYLGRSSHKTDKDFEVKIMNCPQQLGSFECGYYVMDV